MEKKKMKSWNQKTVQKLDTKQKNITEMIKRIDYSNLGV